MLESLDDRFRWNAEKARVAPQVAPDESRCGELLVVVGFQGEDYAAVETHVGRDLMYRHAGRFTSGSKLLARTRQNRDRSDFVEVVGWGWGTHGVGISHVRAPSSMARKRRMRRLRGRTRPASCPQAASMSAPRVCRVMVISPPASRMLRNASIASGRERLKPVPAKELKESG